MEELASQPEIEWAESYDAYARLAGGPAELWALIEPAHRHLRETGDVPGWCGVDFLRGWAFLLTRPAAERPGVEPLERDWFAVLDAISAHPHARLQDLPPTRTD